MVDIDITSLISALIGAVVAALGILYDRQRFHKEKKINCLEKQIKELQPLFINLKMIDCYTATHMDKENNPDEYVEYLLANLNIEKLIKENLEFADAELSKILLKFLCDIYRYNGVFDSPDHVEEMSQEELKEKCEHLTEYVSKIYNQKKEERERLIGKNKSSW